MGWTFGALFAELAERRPDAVAQRHGERVSTWSEFDRTARRLGRALRSAGLQPGAMVAQYLYNTPEYLESVAACFLGGFTPVNTNFRYVESELRYLWDNADAEAVVFDASFLPRVEAIRSAMPKVRHWIVVGEVPACPDWAVRYESLIGGAEIDDVDPDAFAASQLVLYTGGTTGLPKGVLWDHDTLCRLLAPMSGMAISDDTTSEGYFEALESLAARPISLPACPLMHGTGLFTSLGSLMAGGAVVTLPSPSFRAEDLLNTIDHERVTHLTVVGDAFARPINDCLDARPGHWDISSLQVVISSGVMFSEATKQRLLEHHGGQLFILDSLGSSEAMGMGSSVSHAGAVQGTARFTPTEVSVVIKEDGTPAGPGESGRLGVRALVPLGYYKDPERTAATFPVIDGIRYALPGDWAEVLEDGSYRLLGRGSSCINTGGEKVYPEEVEEALKTHDQVGDALVIGVPDERFGEVIVALIGGADGGAPSAESVGQHVRDQIASYKCPRHIFIVDEVPRAANGKADHRRAKALAGELVAVALG